MFKSVLVANRGEIALRVMRTARRLGLRSVAVYSEADRGAMHVIAADEGVEIGPAPSSESYLRQERIIAAALATGAECIHPGCGFLAENAEFAERCAQAGLMFVGPSPEAIRAMGEKDRAKKIAQDIGIPTVPGYAGDAQDDETFAREAERIGYPVLFKAVAGGGGKGLKAVINAGELSDIAGSARREAQAAFGDGRLMIEKLVDPARHIEVQVFGDTKGQVVHLFERECTLQRRNQKVIEEAPAIDMPEGLRRRMTEAALAAAKAVSYLGAGTVEFLLPGGPLTDETAFYFMEMNTRLQIEHPVTELITGLDLVEWQFRVAAGEPLPLAQEAIAANGSAVEARLYAEDPATGFLPSPGRIWCARFPEGEGVRIDSGVETGSEVPPYYDAMIAKIIGYGGSRAKAYDRLLDALKGTVLAGPKTNLAFLHTLGERSAAEGASLSTRYIDRHLAALTQASSAPTPVGYAALALLDARQDEAAQMRLGLSDEPYSPWDVNDGFELAGLREMTYDLDANGEQAQTTVAWTSQGPLLADETLNEPGDDVQIVPAGDSVIVWRDMRQAHLRFAPRKRGALEAARGGIICAPMFGRLTKLFVGEGSPVAVGDRVAVVEAMKMEHVLHAETAGVVKHLPFAEGAQVESGAVVAELETDG